MLFSSCHLAIFTIPAAWGLFTSSAPEAGYESSSRQIKSRIKNRPLADREKTRRAIAAQLYAGLPQPRPLILF